MKLKITYLVRCPHLSKLNCDQLQDNEAVLNLSQN